jgi:acyl-coenzyme A synthetase/AMP-(fatty) acid ligase
MHFHRDVLAICDCYPAEVLRSGTDDIFAGSAPLGFTYGLGSLLLFPMRRGSSTVLLEQSSPEVMLQAIQDFGVTTLLIGPTMYRGMVPHTDRFELSSLHMLAGDNSDGAVHLRSRHQGRQRARRPTGCRRWIRCRPVARPASTCR